ncbi:hypothetical protein V5799_015501 [Amblyomma americanum]|uniref:Uncharacterized protein n=1 Tax=Amblyomma americanum TaxID=6943 RepID=A0AAQ4F8J4_AMBAM
MTPNSAWDLAQSRRGVYDRLDKLRVELEDLRRRCGPSGSDALETLKQTCTKQEEEITRLKKAEKESQEQIEYLKVLLSAKAASNDHLEQAGTCVDHNANSQSFQSELVNRVLAAERRVWLLEEETCNLNILLVKKALQLNKLQLLYSDQSKKLLEATRALSTPSSSRQTSSCDVSYK